MLVLLPHIKDPGVIDRSYEQLGMVIHVCSPRQVSRNRLVVSLGYIARVLYKV